MRRIAIEPLLQRISFFLLCLMPLWLSLSRALTEIAATSIVILFLLASIIKRRSAWMYQPEIQAGFIVWGYLIIHTALLGQLPIKMITYSLIWGRFLLLFAAMRYWLLTDRKRLSTLLDWTIVTVTLLAIDTWWQYITLVSLTGKTIAGERLTGILTTPNIGNLLLKMMVVAIGFALERALPKGRWHLLRVAIWALALIALIPLTGERSITLLLLFGLGILGVLLFVLRPQWRRWVLLGAAIVVAGGAVLSTQDIVHRRAHLLAQQLEHFWETPYGSLYKAGFLLWQEKPILGIGMSQFRKRCPELKDQGIVTYCDIHPHNHYLEWLAEQGLVGIGLLFVMLALIARRAIRDGWAQIRQGAILPLFALTAMAICIFPFVVTQSHFSNWPGMLFWFSLALASCCASVPKEEA